MGHLLKKQWVIHLAFISSFSNITFHQKSLILGEIANSKQSTSEIGTNISWPKVRKCSKIEGIWQNNIEASMTRLFIVKFGNNLIIKIMAMAYNTLNLMYYNSHSHKIDIHRKKAFCGRCRFLIGEYQLINAKEK